MSRNHELETVADATEQPYDEAATFSRGIESALDGYAKDGGTWEGAKQVFEHWIEEGYRVDDALNLALEAAQDEAETTPQEAAKRFWSVLPVDTAIERGLDGYANDNGIWTLGKWTFEDMVEQGESVSDALGAALKVTGQGAESTPARASLRFWDTIHPSYVKEWLDLPINQVPDGVILAQRIHRPVGKIEGAGTFTGDHDGRAVIVKHGEKHILEREHAILSGIDHPGIPHVTTYTEDVEAIGGLTRMAMEQIPGEGLDRIINITRDWKSQPLPTDRAIDITLGLIGDLKALSDAGYLYRDLNPAHVIIDEKKQGRLPVGLVDVESSLDKSADGTAVVPRPRGTLETRCPEEYTHGNVMSEASNVYSISCLLLQMVTGESPFHVPAGTATSDDEELAMSLARHLERPDISVPGPLGDVLRKGLEPDMAKRYQSLEEFRAAVRAAS